MKLKTLKDIEFGDYTYQGNCDEKDVREKLKQEAIKWVKADAKELRGQGMVARNIVAWELLKRWAERFNITEEDLK